MNLEQWQVGDIISQRGDDEQEILEIDTEMWLVAVRCVKEADPTHVHPKSFCKLGDETANHMYRFVFKRRPCQSTSNSTET